MTPRRATGSDRATPARSAGAARKVLNNNVVVTVGADGREQVLMGRGLGFGLGPDDALDPAKIEKTFVLEVDDADSEQIRRLMTDAPYEVIGAVTDAIAEAESSLDRRLPRHVAIALIEHVSYLVQRLEEGIRLPAAPMPEMAVLYPDEFAAAQRMAATIGDRLGRPLPDEETVFLVMHLLNASREDPDGAAELLVRRVQRAATIVEERLGIELDPESPAYARFVLHLKFVLQRLGTGAQLEGPDNSFYEFAKKAHPRAHDIAAQFRDEVREASGLVLTDDEMLYLTMHVERLAQQSGSGRDDAGRQKPNNIQD